MALKLQSITLFFAVNCQSISGDILTNFLVKKIFVTQNWPIKSILRIHGKISTEGKLNGGGPQGPTSGIQWMLFIAWSD